MLTSTQMSPKTVTKLNDSQSKYTQIDKKNCLAIPGLVPGILLVGVVNYFVMVDINVLKLRLFLNALSANPTKTSNELFECAWPFCDIGAERVKILYQISNIAITIYKWTLCRYFSWAYEYISFGQLESMIIWVWYMKGDFKYPLKTLQGKLNVFIIKKDIKNKVVKRKLY